MLFKGLLDKVFLNLRLGMTPLRAVNNVAERYGIHKESDLYEYLLKRAFERSFEKGDHR